MDSTQTAALIGLVVPLIVAIVATQSWPSSAKGWLAAAVSLAVGALSAWTRGQFDSANIMGSVIAAVVAAQASYGMFWRPAGITSWIMEHAGNTEMAE